MGTAVIERLVNKDVFEPIAHSNHAAPLVIVQKKHGTIRVRADYSTGLNDSQSEGDSNPLPSAEDLFAELNGGKFFSQLNQAKACLQIPVEEASQDLSTINIVKGLPKVERLTFGTKKAPKVFQRRMDTLTLN